MDSNFKNSKIIIMFLLVLSFLPIIKVHGKQINENLAIESFANKMNPKPKIYKNKLIQNTITLNATITQDESEDIGFFGTVGRVIKTFFSLVFFAIKIILILFVIYFFIIMPIRYIRKYKNETGKDLDFNTIKGLYIKTLKDTIDEFVLNNVDRIPSSEDMRSKEKDDTERIAQMINTHDPEFSPYEFVNGIKALYVNLENGVSELNISKLRPFETSYIFQGHLELIETYREKKMRPVTTDIVMKRVHLTAYNREDKYELVSVLFDVDLKRYVLDIRTADVVEGSRDEIFNAIYIYEFQRVLGVSSENGMNLTNCPNCNNPLKIDLEGYCEYCDEDITTGEYGWVLSDMEKLS